MKDKMRSITSWSAFPALMLLVVFTIIEAVISGGLSGSFFKTFLLTNAPSICVAIGVSATIFVAGTDISLGSIVSLVNVVIVTLAGKGVPLVGCVLAGVAAAVLCGMFNGFVVGVLRVNPLLTTFATSIAFSGIALWIMPYPSGSVDYALADWYSGMTVFIPTCLLLIGLLLIIWYIIMFRPTGKHIYALGQDVQSAYVSGINVTGIRFLVHTFAGLAAGVAGVCVTANICAGSPVIGSSMSMNSIAAAVIGGISLNGGIGSIWGGVIGALFLAILSNIVVAANLSAYVQSFVSGMILLVGVAFSVIAADPDVKKKIRSLFQKGEA